MTGAISGLEQQTNSLKLSASDGVAQLLEELRQLYSEIFELSTQLMSKLVEITVNKDQSAASEIQNAIALIGDKIKVKTKELREEMRKDLQAI